MGRKKLTREDIQKKLTENFDQDVVLVGEYVNRRTRMLLRCNDCGHEWEALPPSVLYDDYRHKCPNCGIKKGKYVKCAYCGKEIYRSPSQLEKNQSGFFYCSRTCGNLHKNQLREKDGEWENSLSGYRAKAFKEYPHECFICGWNEDERILEVHHIDQNRNHNTKDNLVILCPTCHRKITLQYYTLDLENKKLVPK